MRVVCPARHLLQNGCADLTTLYWFYLPHKCLRGSDDAFLLLPGLSAWALQLCLWYGCRLTLSSSYGGELEVSGLTLQLESVESSRLLNLPFGMLFRHDTNTFHKLLIIYTAVIGLERLWVGFKSSAIQLSKSTKNGSDSVEGLSWGLSARDQ